MTTPEPPTGALDPAMNTAQQLADLAIARLLIRNGVPMFVAPPNESPVGFALPGGWQATERSEAVLDHWRPGWALCAVMGHGFDVIDIDPRSGGDTSLAEMNGTTPRVFGVSNTPSGGQHLWISSLGVGSRDKTYQGIDVKGGRPDGLGRGFVFLPPTIKISKTSGTMAPYTWATQPNLTAWTLARGNDTSGAHLAARIRELMAGSAASGMASAYAGAPGWFREFMESRAPQSQVAAQRAIERKLADVAEWTSNHPEDFRRMLMRAAITLGGYIESGLLDEAEAAERLREAVTAVWGTPDSRDEEWIATGLSDGQHKPFRVYSAQDEAEWKASGYVEATDDEVSEESIPVDEAGGAPPPRFTVYTAIGGEPFDPSGTDQDLAEHVAARMYPALRYGVDTGQWLVRAADRWFERESMAQTAVAQVARLMPVGLSPIPKDASLRTQEHWQAHRRGVFMSSAGASKIASKLKDIAKDEDHPMGIRVSELDQDPNVLWAGGLPWDLTASLDHPVVAEIDLATPHLHTAGAVPNLVPTPAWDRFVAAVWPDEELRAWALRVLGICLSGHPDAAVPVLYGPERTGKSALITLLVRALGTYGHSADPRLLGGADQAHASVVYALFGRRLSFIDEGPRRGHMATERLKQLTGGAPLTGNAMRANPITFEPTHTLVMTTNEEPPITDPALRARMRMIPCESDQAAVRSARQAITRQVWEREAPGVLAKMMMECAAWLAEPDSALSSAAPAYLLEQAEEMAVRQSPVAEWVANCTVPTDPGTPGRELFNSFAGWFEGSPIYRRGSVPTETAFGRALTDLGYPSHQAGKYWYRSLSVMNGPGVIIPWERLNPGNGGTTPAAGFSGSSGFSAGQAPQPATPQNPSSNGTFSTSVSGLAGLPTTTTPQSHTHTPNGVTRESSTGEIGAATETRDTDAPTRQPDLGELPPRGSTSEPAIDPLQDQSLTGNTQGGDTPAVDLPEPEAPTRKVTTRTKTGRVSIDRKLIAAQAREEKRQAAIAAVEGGQVAWPAAVNRAGGITSVSLEQAGMVVRSCVERVGQLDVDIEHTGYPVGHPLHAITAIQLGDDQLTVVFDPADSDQTALARVLIAEAPALGAFSATADLIPLHHAGVIVDLESAWDRLRDPVLTIKLLDPKMTGNGDGLKDAAPALLGQHAVSPGAEAVRSELFKAGKWLTEVEMDTPVERSGWAQSLPVGAATKSATMTRYAASDVLDTSALGRQAAAVAEKSGITAEVLRREHITQRMTARITDAGLALDAEHIRTMHVEHTQAAAELGTEIRERYGIDNPGSKQQVAEVMVSLGAEVGVTKTGRPSVAKDVLERLRDSEGPAQHLAERLIQFNHHRTVTGLFTTPFSELLRGDGRVRPTIYTLGTNTGRMSCVRPNLQQMSKQGGVRAMVTASPGFVLVSADFSSVEVRVAAALSQDPVLARFIADGRDLHGEVALQAFGPDDEASAKAGKPTASKINRYIAKRGVFGYIYGGGITTLAKQLGISEQVMATIIDSLKTITPTLTQWSYWIKGQAESGNRQFPSCSGRVIHFPVRGGHAAPNYAIQGTARELLVDALLRLRETRWGQVVMMPVHDELILEVPEAEGEEASAELVRCMESNLYGIPISAAPSKPAFAWQDAD